MIKMNELIIIVLISSVYLSCLSPNGSEVDWFAIFTYTDKVTGNYEDKSVLYYSYIDNSKIKFDSSMFKLQQFPFWIMIENSTARTINWEKNNIRGSIIKNDTSNAFLLYTLPNFNLKNLEYQLLQQPNSFFCVSIDDDTTKEIINSITIMNINPSYIHSDEMNELMERKIIDRSNISEQIYNFKSIKQYPMTLFTTNENAKENPFEFSIRDYFNDSFYVKSSIKMKYFLSKDCSDQNKLLLNIKSAKYKNTTYDSYLDNSKWAVSIQGNTTCFGDINRENLTTTENKYEGGNVVCFKNNFLQGGLLHFIQGNEDCSNKPDEDEI